MSTSSRSKAVFFAQQRFKRGFAAADVERCIMASRVAVAEDGGESAAHPHTHTNTHTREDLHIPPPEDLRDVPHDQVVGVAKAFIPAFSGFDAAAFDVSCISGGITNALYRVCVRAHTHAESPVALVRIFGANTEVLIDRAKDNETFARLAALGFAPALYGIFSNGRVEEFLTHTHALTPTQMGERGYIPGIARELARMHMLPMPGARSPILWDKLWRWFHMARAVRFVPITPASCHPPVGGMGEREGRQAARLAQIDFDVIEDELKWYSTYMQDRAALCAQFETGEGSVSERARAHVHRIVYAHNDLLSGNVLVPDDDAPEARRAQPVRFIDYEYGDYNPCGFDFANHFCEHAGFDFDLDAHYPSRDSQLLFFREYTAAIATKGEGRCGLAAVVATDELQHFAEEMYPEVCLFTLASHFWWGLWAVVQARHSAIDFDFLGYSIERWKGYMKHKAQFFSEQPHRELLRLA